MKFKARSLHQLAEMICGSNDPESVFIYRSSSFLTGFFRDCDTDYCHDRSSRIPWVTEILEKIITEPQGNAASPPDSFLRVIGRLMDQGDSNKNDPSRSRALAKLNIVLAREGLEAYYGDDRQCYLRNALSKAPVVPANPHRPFSSAEVEKRRRLSSYLDGCSEDELIDEILLPLFRQLGFHRITAAGHKDKSHEFGKDIWMRFALPTQHILYFGLQAKKGKLDAAGSSKRSNANVAEVYQQLLMMLGHEIFDPESSRRVLVDHGVIVAGGEITKAAKSWIGEKLDTTKRSQVLFMEREDILNLFIVNNVPLPAGALPPTPTESDDIPF